MKKTLLIWLTLFCAWLGTEAQNQVINGNFEEYTSCPTGGSQVYRCNNWRQFTGGTSDYFHSCSNSGVNVPNTFVGYQQAASGQAFTGGYQYYQGHVYIYKEYIAGKMAPLTVGDAYEVSMSISLGNTSKFGTNDMGIYFYDKGIDSIPTFDVLNKKPQVSFYDKDPIMDTTNWVRLVDTMRADSTYDNIVIGGFLHYDSLELDSFNKAASIKHAYYFVDSVVVRRISLLDITNVDTNLCASDTIVVVYNTIKRAANNVFYVQLSDETGDFGNGIIIGSKSSDTSGTIECLLPNSLPSAANYRIRIYATSATDTSNGYEYDLHIGNRDSINITATATNPLCEGSTLSFSATADKSPVSYLWTGPNSFNVPNANTSIGSVSSVHSGNYISTVKYYGCEIKDTLTVNVLPRPAKPYVNSNTPVCSGDTIKLYSSTTTSTVTYAWTGPGSYADTVQNATIANSTTSMSGVYTITVTKNGCNNSDTTSVLVKPSPTQVSLSSNTPLCTGDTMMLFSTTSSTGSTYAWTGPGSFSSSSRNATQVNVLPSFTGWYKMTVDYNGCDYQDSTYVNVYPIPPSPIVSYLNPICVGDSLQVSAQNISGAVYSWTGPNSFTANTYLASKANITMNDTGYYKLTITNNGCTSSPDSVKVLINPQPFVVIFPSKDTICLGDQVTFTALPNNANGILNYEWYVNAQYVGMGVSYSANTINDNDVIYCKMADNASCAGTFVDQSNDIQMTVLPWMTPSVSIFSNPSGSVKEGIYIDFTATSTNAGTIPQYQWKRNGTDVIGAQTDKWSANNLSDNDSISVELVSSYRCPQPPTAMSNGIKVHILTSVGSIVGIEGLKLYPNPNTGSFVLEGKMPIGNYKLNIIDILGRRVYTASAIASQGTLYVEINAAGLTQGMYLLSLEDEQGNMGVLRFVVK
ncbi:MAG: T9SS type A sorting domain-containing protein [Chitinophagales bacterium]|nr:T9SS type A sorting domain-containing protein [Chitinophagaceae bacterium]MCB9065803.1 T9SS type A sorting domain-containing protein [Chitinophagales bacterium]